VVKHQLSQQEIDSFFQTASTKEGAPEAAIPFDFRRLDRIPKSQISAIHQLHETFVRTLSSSLSAYLRSFVSGSLISVEQLPYTDFAESLPSQTCIVYLGMQPYEGHSLIEVNPSLIAPILELVLGSNEKLATALNREMTEVEQELMEGFFQIVAHDLRETWKPVVSMEFAIGSVETRPQLSGRFAPTEAVVAIAIELRIGDSVGMINVAIPSITLKMIGQRFDQQWTVHKSANPATEMGIKRKLARHLQVTVDCELAGERISLRDLLSLAPGDLLRGGPVLEGPVDIVVNGIPKFKAALQSEGNKLVAVLQ
jgi:flagellar motor switch protein FliM